MSKPCLRACAVCHKLSEKDELIRIVRSKEGEYSIDLTYKANGRGCYICKNSECLSSARKRNALKRSFKTSVPEEIYELLERYANKQQD